MRHCDPLPAESGLCCTWITPEGLLREGLSQGAAGEELTGMTRLLIISTNRIRYAGYGEQGIDHY